LSGEVPNLYDAAEEYEKVIQGIQSSARDAGISDEDRDGIFSFFISRVRCKLHLVLCMSPVGDVFRLVICISGTHCLIKKVLIVN
jgi:dynein heavy chain